MKKVNRIIKSIVPLMGLLVLSFVTVRGQSVVLYDSQTPNRPISVTGLVVNGIIYDVSIVYNIPIDGTTLSGISESEGLAAQIALVDALNAMMIESNLTRINIVHTAIIEFNEITYSLVGDFTTGVGDWVVSELGTGSGISADNTEGIALFTRTGIVPTIPTLSQWGIMILCLSFLILGIRAVKQHIMEVV